MPLLNRRTLLGGAMAGAAMASVAQTAAAAPTGAPAAARPWPVIDTNLSLFQWPFRRLPYDTPEALVAKLESLQIDLAWAGSFEGILHRDIRGVNQRLVEACRDEGRGRLLPIGSLNPNLPDWQQDLRICHQQHRMPGIRLHPNYHGYSLRDRRFLELLKMAADGNLLVQVCAALEDQRTQHPMLRVQDVDLAPLPEVIGGVPNAKVMILNYKPTTASFEPLADCPGIYFDIARVEGTDGVARMVRSAAGGRVLFGTHAPFLIYESALIKVYESDLDDSETRGLCAEHASRLIAAAV